MNNNYNQKTYLMFVQTLTADPTKGIKVYSEYRTMFRMDVIMLTPEQIKKIEDIQSKVIDDYETMERNRKC